ncbi:serine-enriched protein [Gigaspora margarita]|uniref:Serine-enriched protein n=1 Tax=Gigaspora margarita TaxID=4874 RepID=A0A8H4AXG3_GIGMA|nr:serine-enriched protein [Gigaspora margarita]
MNNSISIDFSKLLENPEGYNVKIIVGEEPNVKEFKAHSLILTNRSDYFKNAFSSRWARIENGIIIFNKPNISPPVFKVLLKYLYTGIISIENNEISLVDIAIASDELQLFEVYQQVEERLLENKLAWKPRDLITGFQLSQDTNLYNVAIGLGPTVVVIKVRNSGEIIGGYNPLKWCRIKTKHDERSRLLTYNNDFDHQCRTSNSFIFSLTNQAFPILSQVSSKEEAIIWCRNKGPCFGLQDLHVTSLRPNNIICKSKKHSYEKKVISRETFEIEEYEVFQIIDKRFSQYINRWLTKTFQFIICMYIMITSCLVSIANVLFPDNTLVELCE